MKVKTIGQTLKEIRTDRQITQVELGQMFGDNGQKLVSKIESHDDIKLSILKAFLKGISPKIKLKIVLDNKEEIEI